jgi:alcohol dehydrogenase (NADP+)
VAGSNIGSPDMIKRMLDFVKEKDIKPWIQKYDMEDINKALPDFRECKPRYRFVLVNKANGGVM